MARTPGAHQEDMVKAESQDELGAIVDRYRGKSAAVIALMQDLHRQFGYLPEEALRRVAAELDIPLSRLYSLATFYSSFRLSPMGKHKVCVCVGTACHVKGAARIVEALERDLKVTPGETTKDGEFTMETVNCLGACALAPLVVVDEEYHGRMDPKKASKLVEEVAGGGAKDAEPAA